MKKMVVLAKNNKSNDGMDLRISEMDNHLRKFFDVEYFVSNGVLSKIASINRFKKAEVIYIHSMFNYARSFPEILMFGRKTILDLHGSVPSELRLEGRRFKAIIFSILELTALVSVRKLICVSLGMRDHYAEVLNRIAVDSAEKCVLVPIMNNASIDMKNMPPSEAREGIIYAGGLQKWQNVDLMLNIAKSISNFRFLFFFNDNAIKDTLRNPIPANIIISSVEKHELIDFYSRSKYGFLLRDNSIINKVADPTKMTEYIRFGVIPIVITDRVCSISSAGYNVIMLDDFLNGDLPSDITLDKMRIDNINKLKSQIEKGEHQLKILLEDVDSSW